MTDPTPQPSRPLSADDLALLRSLAAKTEHAVTMHPSLLRSAIATIDQLTEENAAQAERIASLKADISAMSDAPSVEWWSEQFASKNQEAEAQRERIALLSGENERLRSRVKRDGVNFLYMAHIVRITPSDVAAESAKGFAAHCEAALARPTSLADPEPLATSEGAR